MSSRSVEPAGRPRSAWSIVGRLTMLYTVSLVLLFGAMSVFLYFALEHTLHGQATTVLMDKIAVLREIVRERPENEDALEEEVRWESGVRKNSAYYARLLDARGGVKLESAQADKFLPSAIAFPSPAGPAQAMGATLPHLENGRAFLLTAALVEGPGGQIYRYQLGLDVSDHRKILMDFRVRLGWALLLLMFLSAGLGAAIARDGMRPVRQITAAAQGVSASALHARISGTAWPRELAVLAREFDRMLERLEESFVRLAQFSADLAHELRTPIHNVMGEAQFALLRPRDVNDYRRVLQSSVEETERIARMIDSLLFLARADDPSLRLQRQRCRFQVLVAGLLDAMELLASEGGLTLAADGDADLWVDCELFRRLLSNLISNALKHTPPGGEVQLRCTQQVDGVAVTVQDTGEGIAPEHLPKLFDRFYRVDAARKQHGGTGLGLAICRKIVDLHDGTITVTSKPEAGTTVTIKLPRCVGNESGGLVPGREGTRSPTGPGPTPRGR